MQFVKLKAFSKFDSTVDALSSATALVDSKLSKGARLSMPFSPPHMLYMALQ